MQQKNKKSTALALSDYDYCLPAELIAQAPASPREAARLMTVDKTTGDISDRHFFDLPELLQPGDVLVFNDSKVIPARLIGHKKTGGKIEIFLLKALSGSTGNKTNSWQCLIGGKVKPEQKVFLTEKIFGVPKEKLDEKTWLVEFNAADKKLFTLGQTPLPPYIKASSKLEDYQNVYAKAQGSVAAPTAGLHFSRSLIGKLKKRGVQIEFVTLHVGLGTFLPVEEENILEHKMHSELASIDASTAERLNAAKKAGRRIIAVGTTTCRTLESLADKKSHLKAGSIDTEIFIYPGYEFKFVDALITNFHLPKSTLLMLVAALAGKKLMDKAYCEAIERKYRFYSFGDGMMIR